MPDGSLTRVIASSEARLCRALYLQRASMQDCVLVQSAVT
jgi:hypothetical protein